MSLTATLMQFIELVWNDGTPAAATGMIADTYTVFHDPGDPWDGQTLDKAGFVARVDASRAMAPDQRFTIVDSIEGPDRVWVAWTWRGTHSGAIGDVPASGRTITMSGLTVYRFRDGLITGHWQVADRLGVYRQLMPGQVAG